MNRMTRTTRLGLLSAALLPTIASAALAQTPAPAPVPAEVTDPSAETLVVRRCMLEYERKTDIGASAYSVLQDCLVQPGERVKAGQVLGRLQDGEARADVALREIEASSDIEVRLSEARRALATTKLERTAMLVRRNAASPEEYLQHKQEAAAATLEVEQARHRRKVAGYQLEHARAVLQTRTLISPHDGVVATVLRRKGESVAPRDPVFQVVDPSEIRVVALVDVTEAWRLRLGQAVRVIPEIAGADLPLERQAFAGTLSFIDSQFEPMTRTCKVFVKVPNREGVLRAGLEARIEIDPAPASSAAPTVPTN